VLVIGLWLNVRLARPIRGLWRILDWKVEGGLISDLELLGGIPCLCQLRTDRLASVSKFDYVLAHAGFMGPCKHSSLCNYLVEP
jgi:hypothetical protein